MRRKNKDRELRKQKNKYEEKLENISKNIENSRSQKSELELKIDQYERLKHSQDAEFDNEFKMKEMDVQYKIKTHEALLLETEKQLENLKEERAKLQNSNEQLQQQINDLEKETMMEVSELENQISKIGNDLEDVRQKVIEKQNNPKVEQMTEFFTEAKSYIGKYKNELERKDNIKNLKVAFFNLQRRLNDKQFENSQ